MKELEKNPCSLPPFTMNQEVQDLPQLLEDIIGSAVQYTCAYWAEHLKLSPTTADFTSQIIDLAINTLENTPVWIEVMSLGNHLGEVIYSINSLLDLLGRVSTPYP